MSESRSIDRLRQALKRLPGVGPKTAQRMAFHLLERDREGARLLAEAINDAADSVKHCVRCNNFSETETCAICTSPKREAGLLCVVETPADLETIEQAGAYTGLYFVLMGYLSPLDGIGPDDLHVDSLLERLNGVKEVVIATNPSAQGETTALYLAKILKPKGVKVSKLARGIPMGGDLEYTDEATIVSALEGRVEL